MYKRWQQARIEDALNTRRVLLLSGPRQCGKTTLVESYEKQDTIYRTLDDLSLLAAAKMDPHGFVTHDNELMIIDEIQRCPELLQAIKMDVDKNKAMGRFLLTGSANIQSLPSVKESLAGRVRHLRLRPLVQGEIEEYASNFLSLLFDNDLDIASSFNIKETLIKADYLDMALSGGYPEPLTLHNQQHKKEWFDDYLEALIQKDLKDIVQIRRTDSLRKLLQILAAWSSRLIDFSAIGSGLSISKLSLISYVGSLEMLYLIERVPPWTKTMYDRVGKKEKLFMTDTGMLGHLLNWNREKIHLDATASGLLIETFVFTQLAALIDAQSQPYHLFHYRDKDKREIDFVIENGDGDIVCIEVKAGSSVSKDSFKHLFWFKNKFSNKKPFKGIVLYTGAHKLSFGDGFWALPISSLWKA
ncbi:MAG TPA: hypothetical protein DIC42_06285 [Holosporales bacterium]|nr:hypothetical protein [Holosporales bacterium]